MPRETKAARIHELDARGDFTTQEIADAVGCIPAYVRTVRARKRGGGISVADRNWMAKVSQAGGYESAKPVRRAEYQRLRKAGFSRKAAHKIASRAFQKAAYSAVKKKDTAHA